MGSCTNCEENQQSLSKQSSRISETDVKIENMEVKKPLDASELKDKADVPVTLNKPVFHNLDTGVKLCIHDVLIEDFCQSCSESQVKVGHEKSSNESGGKIEVKSHDTAVGKVQQKTERKKDTTEKSETLLQSQNAPLLQSNKESKTKTNEQHQTRSIETKEKDASDVKIEIETKQEVRESDAFKKDIPKKRNNSNNRKKTQEFKPNELDELRGDFAKKQGVKETKDINTIQTVNKQADTDISPLEVKTASSNESANKETVETPVMREQICVHDILVTEPCEKCDESQSHNTLKNYMPTKEERKKKGRKSKEIRETESMYEPVGKGNETTSQPHEKKKEGVDKVPTKEIDFEATKTSETTEEKVSGGISNLTDDLKDFGSLKRKSNSKNKEQIVDNFQIAEYDQSKQSQEDEVLADVDFQRKDDVIGFDINIKDDNTNPFVTEEEFDEIAVTKEKDKTPELESPAKIIPPPLPARRKNSKQLSSSDSAQNVTSEQKEKKTSFVKEWQKDLKEFFSLGKKKKTDNNSLSRGSSSKRSDTESWQVDFSKYEKDHDADEASKEGNMSKGENYRFSSSQENLNGESRTKEKPSKNLPENEDIYGYSKDLSSTDVDADKPVEVEYEQISSRGDGMTEAVAVDETVERRKKKRRDRRKTNSESSCTKVEIPPFPADDQPKQSPNISSKTCSCIHDIPISSDCKSCSENQSSLNRRSSKVQKTTQDNVKEITTKKEAMNEKKNEINMEESNTPLNKSTKSQKVTVSCQKCIHEINISDVCEGCNENQKSLDRKESKKTDVNIKVKTQKDRTAEVLGKEESKPIENKSLKLQKYEKSCQKCIHDVNLTDLYNDCDENQKSLDRRATKKPTKQNSPNNQSKSASKETQEDPLKQVKRRNKNKGSRVPSELTEGESKVDQNTLSIGSKPKVVVPSPQGIPRPKPINKRDTNRDSIISDDGFFLEDNMKTDRNGPAEETEEFRKAVESFDQIYLLESGNQSPEITPRESSTHAKKLTKTDEDQKPNLSPSTAWKKLKTGKSFDASENENQVVDFTTSEMRFEQQDSSTFSETKSFNSSESSSFKTQSSSKQTSEEMKIESSNNKKQSSRQEQSFEAEDYIISGMAESKFESQSQSYQSSTVEEKKSSSKMLKKGTSIELSESTDNQSYVSENRKNEEYKLESSQSSKSSLKKNNNNKKSIETS